MWSEYRGILNDATEFLLFWGEIGLFGVNGSLFEALVFL